MAKSLMSNIKAVMSKQDEKRGLAKLLENVQEVQDVQQVQDVQEVEPKTAEPLIHHGQEVYDVQEVTAEHVTPLIREVQEVQDVQEVAAKPLIHDVQEVEGRRTQGKKGAKLPRAHISLSPAMYKHLRIASVAAEMTMSEYVERLLIADKEKSSRVD